MSTLLTVYGVILLSVIAAVTILFLTCGSFAQNRATRKQGYADGYQFGKTQDMEKNPSTFSFPEWDPYQKNTRQEVYAANFYLGWMEAKVNEAEARLAHQNDLIPSRSR